MTTAHETRILGAVLAGESAYSWHSLELDGLTIEVLAQPLVVDGVRPSMTPVAAQLVVDALGELGGEPCALLTPALADLIWQRADHRITPQVQQTGWRGHGCPTCAAYTPGPWRLCAVCGGAERSRAEDAALGDVTTLERMLGRPPLLAGIGKPWALSQSVFRRHRMIGQPYGWFVHDSDVTVNPRSGRHEWGGIPVWRSASGGAWVVQPVGAVAPHDGLQFDYAEPLMAWRAPGVGVERVLSTPELSRLVGHEGPLPSHRLPSVPCQAA